jgi:hypothetical protein
MAFITKTEFAELCGVELNALSVYIKRNKVVVVDNLIDPENPINKVYKDKQALNKQKKNPDVLAVDTQQAAPAAKNAAPAHAVELDGANGFQLNNIKTIQQIEKLKEEIEKLRIGNAKLQGEVIPTELATTATIQLAKELGTAHKNWAENFLLRIAQRYKLKNEDVAAERGEMIKCINSATDGGIETAVKNLDTIVNDYAIKRAIGEHS